MPESTQVEVTAKELRFWNSLAHNAIDGPEPVREVGLALGQAVHEIIRLRAGMIKLGPAPEEIAKVRSKLAYVLGLNVEDLGNARRPGPDAKLIRIAVAAEILRRRGLTREKIALVLGYRGVQGVDRAQRMLQSRMTDAGFRVYLQRVDDEYQQLRSVPPGEGKQGQRPGIVPTAASGRGRIVKINESSEK